VEGHAALLLTWTLIISSCPQGSREDEDDFLCGEAPQAEGIVGMTPSSYESSLHSPSSVGSPPLSFQRP